jgi:hypothetical protein
MSYLVYFNWREAPYRVSREQAREVLTTWPLCWQAPCLSGRGRRGYVARTSGGTVINLVIARGAS